jgi:hypothetical protein
MATENALLQPVLNTMLSVPRTGERFDQLTFATDGDIYPTLGITMQQIWSTLLAREQSHRKLKTIPTDMVAPSGSLRSALLVMAHYPTDGMVGCTMYDPLANYTIFELFSKLGMEKLSGQSKVKQYGALAFDACPMKKPIMRTYNYNTDHIPRHYRQYIDSMWTRSTSRVGIVLGRIPDAAFADVFRHRIRLVAKKVYRSTGNIHYVSRVYFMYANADDMDANRIQRVVFKTCHPENFQCGRSFSDDASRLDSGHHMNDRLLACEQFIDAATFLAVGQVPGPMLLSHPAAYYKPVAIGAIVPITAFTKQDGSLEATLLPEFKSRSTFPIAKWMQNTRLFTKAQREVIMASIRDSIKADSGSSSGISPYVGYEMDTDEEDREFAAEIEDEADDDDIDHWRATTLEGSVMQ